MNKHATFLMYIKHVLKMAWVFVVNNTDRLPTGYGQDYYSYHFYGGTLYSDASTGIIWVENQVSLGSIE